MTTSNMRRSGDAPSRPVSAFQWIRRGSSGSARPGFLRRSPGGAFLAARAAWRAAAAAACALLLLALFGAPPARAAGVVGGGSPAGCTDQAFGAALQGGGAVTFNCGPGPVTILVAGQKTIAANTSVDGGGLITLAAHGSRHFVVNQGVTLQLKRLTLRDGYAAGDGGAIFNRGAVVIEDSLLAGNRTDAAHSGGAIVNYGSLTIRRSTLEDNAGGGGGAVYPRWGGSRTVIEYSILRRNAAVSPSSGWGGAILLWDGAPLVISDSLLEENTASYGGGIYNFPASSIAMTRTILRANRALYGGGIYNERAAAEVKDSQLLENIADRTGGGIDNRGGALTVTGSIFNRNAADYAEGTGGGINNQAGYNAGTGQSEPGRTVLADVSLSANRAGMTGGGIENGYQSQAILARVTLDGNTAPRGAAIFNSGALEVDAGTLSGNAAVDHGGAVYQSEGSLALDHATLADNTAGDGSALYLNLDQGPAATLLGVIVAGGGCAGAMPTSLGYNLDQTGSCGLSGPGDKVGANPQLGPLAANGGLTRTRMPALKGPAADAGGPACQEIDQRGEPRPAGAACDIGAVEAVELPPVCDPGTGCVPTLASPGPDAAARNARQEAGLARLKAASAIPVTALFDNGALEHAIFDLPGPARVYSDSLALWFLGGYKDLLGTDDPWQLVRRSPDEMHIFFRQLHDGIPVYPTELAVRLGAGKVVGVDGAYVTGPLPAGAPAISALEAEQAAVAAAGRGATVRGDTQLRYLNLGLLGERDRSTRLAWRMALDGPGGPETVFVDAASGAVLRRESRSPDGVDGYDLDLENGNNEQLKDLCGLFDDDDIDAGFDADAALASNGIWQAYYYWRNNFGRDSYDDDGEQIEFNIHVRYLDANGNTTVNASYSKGCDIFGASNGMVTRDILAHELTHAVVNNEVGVPYQGQQGALDESLSDTFAAFLDGNWTIGEGSPLGVIRTMNNPPANGHPDRMSNYLNTAADNGGVHSNSGILNKAAWLITAGQNGFNGHNVRGLGAGKAQGLYYNVLVNRLRSNSDFYDMARQMVAEAKALRAGGAYSNADVCSVIEAFAAVELGPADRDCNGLEDNLQDDDGDGVPNSYPDPGGSPWDNCRTIKNPTQGDNDGDGLGDSCDSDSDNDGVPDYNGQSLRDNCRWVPNPSQADRDKDGIGDACDSDRDADYVANGLDNCPNTYNPGQEDVDRDRVGDVCDEDADADLICNIGGPKAAALGLVAGLGCSPGQGRTGGFAVEIGGFGMPFRPADNCPLNANANQADGDVDGVGDLCDLCPGFQGSDNGDPDGDGRGNACDPDDDNDGVPDYQADGKTPLDNCRETPNPSQADTDRNGIGMACDSAEQAAWLRLRQKGVQVKFRAGDVVPVPIDNCPQCGVGYLPNRLETRISLAAPVAIAARVVDSGGFVVARSTAFATAHTLTFTAPPFAGSRLRAPGAASAASLEAASPEVGMEAQAGRTGPDTAGFEALRAAGLLGPSPAAAQAYAIPAADTAYYLELAPGPGVNVSAPIQVQIKTEQAPYDTSPEKTFLPALRK